MLQETDGSLAITLEGKRAISFHRTLAEADFVAVATFDVEKPLEVQAGPEER